MNEIFKDITGFEGLYKIGDYGTVVSLAKEIHRANGGTRLQPEMILKHCIVRGGYHRVTLFKEKKRFRIMVHRLVAMHFIRNPENKPEVNHLFGDKNDNSASSLEWATRSENGKHAYRIGLKRPQYSRLGTFNELNGRSKKILQLSLLGEKIKEWPSVQEVRRRLGFRQGNVSSCARNKLKTAYGFKWQYAN